MGNSCRFYVDISAMHEEVTGSCLLATVKFPNKETLRFIVDCGLYQEQEYESLNRTLNFKAEKIDFALVTHVHVDHIGRLPYLVKKGFSAPIYTTDTSCKLLPLALKDSFKVLNSSSKRKNEKCLYSESDVDVTISLLRSCRLNQTIHLNPYVKCTFLSNGHIVGAASILVQISYPEYEDINLLFTGDYNNKNTFFDVPKIPRWIQDLPLNVIQESTYGYMNSTDMVPCFRENVSKCVENGGTAVALVFSLGRSQEILYELKCMQKSGQLSKDIPIYMDGKLAIRYTGLFQKDDLGIKQSMLDFLPENLTFVDKTNRRAVLDDTNAKVILTSSGNGSYGPAQTYIPEYITRRNALIQFTGYTTEGSLGYRLRQTEPGDTVEVGGLVARKRAKVEYTNEFSAHAKADEMIAFLQQFKKLKFVGINHGETATKNAFAERILKEVEVKNVGLLGRQYLFRVSTYGLIKTLSTKFEN